MAINFKVTLRQNPNEIHLRLNGDFDGSSACELLNILEKSCQLVSRVFIHTNGLRYIYPFGSSLFRNHLSDLKHRKHLLLEFTGGHARELDPDGVTLHFVKSERYS